MEIHFLLPFSLSLSLDNKGPFHCLSTQGEEASEAGGAVGHK